MKDEKAILEALIQIKKTMELLIESMEEK